MTQKTQVRHMPHWSKFIFVSFYNRIILKAGLNLMLPLLKRDRKMITLFQLSVEVSHLKKKCPIVI